MNTVMRQTYQPPILAAGSPLTGPAVLLLRPTLTASDVEVVVVGSWVLGLDEVGTILLRYWRVQGGGLGIEGDSLGRG